MKYKLLAAVVVSAAMVAGCGGGGKDAGTSVFGTGTTSTAAASVSALSLALSDSKLSNGDATTTISATATATDSGGKTLVNVPVTFTVSGGVYSQTTTVTDDNGNNVAKVRIGADKSNRTIVVTATAGSKTAGPVYITVTGSKISSVASPAVVAPSAAGTIAFTLKDANSVAVANQTIDIQSTSGVAAAKGTTDANGEYVYHFTAPSTTGTITATASALGVVSSQDVLVQSSSSSIAAVTAPIKASIEANPSVVSVNATGSTLNKSVVRALFKDSTNKALKNVRVKFDLNGDVNNVGGTFSVADAYSDNEGYAVTSYIPSTLSSPTGGLTIRACYSSSGDSKDACTAADTKSVITAITVVSSTVSLTAGTDEKIGVDQDLVYYKRYVVQVVDASGFPKANVAITPQLDLIRYAKGYYYLSSSKKVWTRADVDILNPVVSYYECAAEDANSNSFLDTTEDLNNSGTLEPRRADVAVTFEDAAAGGKTDANGRIILRVTYPRSVASWVTAALTVSGSVDGSEGRTSKVFDLPVPADAITTVTSSPAFDVSPYGLAYEDYTVPVTTTFPNGQPKTAGTVLTPCQNPD